MRAKKYDFWIKVTELHPPLGEDKFVAKAVIHEIGVGEIQHGLSELWGKTREEADSKMRRVAEQWIQVNEK